MLQFHGKNINSKYDLLLIKVQLADFVKPLKFEKEDEEKLYDLIFELTKGLVFNQVDAYMYLNYCKQERKKGLEVYIYNKSMTIEKVQGILNSNYSLDNNISLDKSFFDSFELKQDSRLGAEIRILKLLK